jgi:hypothetical protein
MRSAAAGRAGEEDGEGPQEEEEERAKPTGLSLGDASTMTRARPRGVLNIGPSSCWGTAAPRTSCRGNINSHKLLQRLPWRAERREPLGNLDGSSLHLRRRVGVAPNPRAGSVATHRHRRVVPKRRGQRKRQDLVLTRPAGRYE